MKKFLKENFLKIYGYDNDIKYFFSPGRVNIIGEYTDFNGGYVMPAAINLGIYAAVSFNRNNCVKVFSENEKSSSGILLNENFVKSSSKKWINYILGVFENMKDKYTIPGMDIYIYGTLPESSGLSSSAALEVLIAYIIGFYNKKTDRTEIALIGQAAENNFVGVNCGIMDQFAVANGKADKTLILNCSTLDFSYNDFKLDEYCLIIINSGKKRQLSDSKYNERKSECDKALEIINKSSGEDKNFLCEYSTEYTKYISDNILYKRAFHVISENSRVKDAALCLKNKDFKEFGKILYESHNSLRDNFEVTGFELDTLVSLSSSHKGCIGARMTGAGFGGCSLAVVKNSDYEDFINYINKNYTDLTGLKADFFKVEISDGVKFI